MVNFNDKELEVLKFWEEHRIFEESLKKGSPQGNFVFYEGPPTANGKPGIHHLLARCFKDLVPRYKTMRGFQVERKAGWDTHGLPVEIQVEKELGISGKPEIEKYGVEEFNKKCRESVWKYKEEWEQLTRRMGFWLDMSNPYITYESDYIESVWSIFKKVWDQNLIYQGFKVVLHCPRCGTTLSSHEVAQGYKTVTDNSIYLKFKVAADKGPVKQGDYILSWTTTPWTLPGNVALAVGKDIKYARVQVDEDYYWLAENLVNKVLGEKNKVETVVSGQELIDVKYQPLFKDAIEAGEQTAWQVVPASFVTTEDGTGIVHTAVMYGLDDYELGLEINLPQQHTVDTAGKFLASVRGFAGDFVKDPQTEAKIIDYLKRSGSFLREMPYKHEYPFCWRCDTPLLYYAKTSWFIAMTNPKVKSRLLKNAAEINWYPSHIKKGRFGEWIDGVKDWAISRERYWGTPMPVWICTQCQKQRCLGSRADLGIALDDLHKPFIDNVILTCACGGEMHRVPEVLDVWFDAGSMPLAQHHYPFENEELIDSGEAYPADFICEGMDQTRGWFYTMLAVSTLINKGTSYKNCISLGLINDAKGQKMSKSRGNVVDPNEMMKKYGADAVRLFFYTISQPGETKRFDEQQLLQIVKKNFILLDNIISFYTTFARGQRVDFQRPEAEDIMDRWILAYTDQTAGEITRYLDEYKITEAGRLLIDYINELSTWYIRRSRERFKSETEKPLAVATLAYVLKNLAKLLAPFMPFTAENIWQTLAITSEQSVHLAEWPELSSAGLADENILTAMAQVRALVEAAHAVRAEAKLKVRQPLAEAQFVPKLPIELQAVLADEINVQKVTQVDNLTEGTPWLPHEDKQIALNVELTAELRNEGAVRELVRSANALRKQAKLTPQDIVQIAFTTDSASLKELISSKAARLGQETHSKPWLESKATHQSLAATVNNEQVILSIV